MPRTHEMSRRQRHPVPTEPCGYTKAQGGTHPEGCVYVSYADRQRALQQILTKRRKRQAVKASRRANR